jgi:hypothetical protein
MYVIGFCVNQMHIKSLREEALPSYFTSFIFQLLDGGIFVRQTAFVLWKRVII